jgi:hypothetical protein
MAPNIRDHLSGKVVWTAERLADMALEKQGLERQQAFVSQAVIDVCRQPRLIRVYRINESW